MGTSKSIFETAVTTTPEGVVLTPEEILAEVERVVAMRTKRLVGKVVQGTLFTTGKDSKMRYWIRWNSRKCDAVFMDKKLVESLGDKLVPGMQLRCTIKALGPELAKLAFKSAWCMHPQTDAVEFVHAVRTGKTFESRIGRSKVVSPTSRPRRMITFGRTRATDSPCWRRGGLSL